MKHFSHSNCSAPKMHSSSQRVDGAKLTAPALAKADVGVAMGTGTDVAMNSAQLTLVKRDLRDIAVARALSEATVANMKQNLLFALLYNALAIPIAALTMSFSSVSVIGNALRLRVVRTLPGAPQQSH